MDAAAEPQHLPHSMENRYEEEFDLVLWTMGPNDDSLMDDTPEHTPNLEGPTHAPMNHNVCPTGFGGMSTVFHHQLGGLETSHLPSGQEVMDQDHCTIPESSAWGWPSPFEFASILSGPAQAVPSSVGPTTALEHVGPSLEQQAGPWEASQTQSHGDPSQGLLPMFGTGDWQSANGLADTTGMAGPPPAQFFPDTNGFENPPSLEDSCWPQNGIPHGDRPGAAADVWPQLGMTVINNNLGLLSQPVSALGSPNVGQARTSAQPDLQDRRVGFLSDGRHGMGDDRAWGGDRTVAKVRRITDADDRRPTKRSKVKHVPNHMCFSFELLGASTLQKKTTAEARQPRQKEITRLRKIGACFRCKVRKLQVIPIGSKAAPVAQLLTTRSAPKKTRAVSVVVPLPALRNRRYWHSHASPLASERVWLKQILSEDSLGPSWTMCQPPVPGMWRCSPLPSPS